MFFIHWLCSQNFTILPLFVVSSKKNKTEYPLLTPVFSGFGIVPDIINNQYTVTHLSLLNQWMWGLLVLRGLVTDALLLLGRPVLGLVDNHIWKLWQRNWGYNRKQRARKETKDWFLHATCRPSCPLGWVLWSQVFYCQFLFLNFSVCQKVTFGLVWRFFAS